MNKYFILLIVYFKLTVSSFAISNIDARTWILIDYHSMKLFTSLILIQDKSCINDKDYDLDNRF